MYFKGIDLTYLDNKDIYNLVLERKLLTFPPGYWCSLSVDEGKEIALELLKYLIEEKLKLTRDEILNNTTKEFILNNKLWTPCKLYFGRSAIKYVMALYKNQYRAFEFNNSRIPQGYWSKSENRVEAIKWLLEEKLKWSLDDIKEKFNRNMLFEYGLGTLTTYYTSSIDIINEIYPNEIHCWELKRSSVSPNYWEIRGNRVIAVRWLVKEKLKFNKEQIINELSIEHFSENKLSTLICDYYNKSISAAIIESFNNEIMPQELKYHRLNKDQTRKATVWLVYKLYNEKGKSVNEINYYDFKENKLRHMIDKYYSSSPEKAIVAAINE